MIYQAQLLKYCYCANDWCGYPKPISALKLEKRPLFCFLTENIISIGN